MLVFTPIMMINHRHKMGGFCILNSDSDFTISIFPFFLKIMAIGISVEECILTSMWMNI